MRTRARMPGGVLLLLFLALLTATATSAPQRVSLALSTPNAVGPNETVSIVAEVKGDTSVNGSVTVFNDTKTVKQFTYGPGQAPKHSRSAAGR